MLKKYNANINIEICSFIKVITYLYKYICKDYDIADISIMAQCKENHNKITKFYILQ